MNAPCHLVLGGQRSGKSRHAEGLAADWLSAAGHEAVLLATARAGDDEMLARIERHRLDRAERVPGLGTHEVPLALAEAVRQASASHRLVVVDCLTLWLTNLIMPLEGPPLDVPALARETTSLGAALRAASGPVVLVSNEIGLGLSPMTREARRFVDDLGRLHQDVAAVCSDVTLMVAGIPLSVKRSPSHRPFST